MVEIVAGTNYAGGNVTIPETGLDFAYIRLVQPIAQGNKVLSNDLTWVADGTNLVIEGTTDVSYAGYRIAFKVK